MPIQKVAFFFRERKDKKEEKTKKEREQEAVTLFTNMLHSAFNPAKPVLGKRSSLDEVAISVRDRKEKIKSNWAALFVAFEAAGVSAKTFSLVVQSAALDIREFRTKEVGTFWGEGVTHLSHIKPPEENGSVVVLDPHQSFARILFVIREQYAASSAEELPIKEVIKVVIEEVFFLGS